MLKKITVFLAMGFGSGMLIPAPGTWGSLAALLIGLIWYFFGGIPLWFIAIAAIIGTYICHKAEQYLQVNDPPEIVLDEFIGMWIAIWNVPLVLWPASFLFFRYFDITKPGPIKKSQDLVGGLGIMADDVLAGIVSRLLVAVAIYILF